MSSTNRRKTTHNFNAIFWGVLFAFFSIPSVFAEGDYVPFTAPLKSTFVVSVSSLEQGFAAMEKLSNFADSRAAFLRFQTDFQEKYGSVIDLKRPLGFVLLSDGEMLFPLIFFPVLEEEIPESNENPSTFLNSTDSGTSEDLEISSSEENRRFEPGEIVVLPNGEKRIFLDQYSFSWPLGFLWGVQKGKWVYIAVEELLQPAFNDLGQPTWNGLPEDPTYLLDRLEEKYLAAYRIDFSGLPRDLFNGLLIVYNMIVHAIDPNEVQTEYRVLFRSIGRYYRILVNEMETCDRGIKFDPTTGDTSITTTLRIVPGSAMSRYIESRKQHQSAVGGFFREDASFSLIVSDELYLPQKNACLAVSGLFRESILDFIREEESSVVAECRESEAELHPFSEDPFSEELPISQQAESAKKIGGALMEHPLPDSEVDSPSSSPLSPPPPPPVPQREEAPLKELLEEDSPQVNPFPETEPLNSGDFNSAEFSGYDYDYGSEMEEYGIMPNRMSLIFGETFAKAYEELFAISRRLMLDRVGEKAVVPLFDFLDRNIREGRIDCALSRGRDRVLIGAFRVVEGEKIGELLGYIKEHLDEHPVHESKKEDIRIHYEQYGGFSLSVIAESTLFSDEPSDSVKKTQEVEKKETSGIPNRIYFGERSDMLCFAVGPEPVVESVLKKAIDDLQKPTPLPKKQLTISAVELESVLGPLCSEENNLKLFRRMIANNPDAKITREVELSSNLIHSEIKIEGAFLGFLAWFFMNEPGWRMKDISDRIGAE